ncbi:hypothetical protein ABTN75_19925, partial [Acinetobacter baumannii]
GAVINTNGFTIEQMTVEGRAALQVMVPAGVDQATRVSLTADVLKKQEDGIDLQRQKLRRYFEQAQRYLAAKKAGELASVDTKLEAMAEYV